MTTCAVNAFTSIGVKFWKEVWYKTNDETDKYDTGTYDTDKYYTKSMIQKVWYKKYDTKSMIQKEWYQKYHIKGMIQVSKNEWTLQGSSFFIIFLVKRFLRDNTESNNPTALKPERMIIMSLLIWSASALIFLVGTNQLQGIKKYCSWISSFRHGPKQSKNRDRYFFYFSFELDFTSNLDPLGSTLRRSLALNFELFLKIVAQLWVVVLVV